MPADVEHIWLAGVLDARGSLDLHRRRTPRLVIPVRDKLMFNRINHVAGTEWNYIYPGDHVPTAWRSTDQKILRPLVEAVVPYMFNQAKIDRFKSVLS